MLVWEQAAALQRSAMDEVSQRFSGVNAPAGYTVRDLESAAIAAGIPARLIRRAVAEVAPSKAV